MSAQAQRAAPSAPGRLLARPGAASALAAAAVAVAVVAWERAEFQLGPSAAVWDALRAAAAAGVLFGACGYAAARVLAPPALRAQAGLLAFPLGAVLSALALTALGLLHVPFGASLPLVLAAGAASAVWVRVRRGPLRAEAAGARVDLWPLFVAALIFVVVLSPVWRTGIATVVGKNGDVVLAVGSADLVKEAPPTAVRPELGIDRIPLVWRSKYPIFYSLAAVSELSGLTTVEAFPLLSALVLAMAAFGFGLLVGFVLRAPPWAAPAAMAFVGLERMAVHVADHPYYNQLWALFALPFILVTGWSFLRSPSRAGLALLGLFAAAGAFAYPLMLPFPALFLAVAAVLEWRRRRARGEPLRWVSALGLGREGLPGWAWVPAGLALLAVGAVLIRGVGEKAISAVTALAPGGDLSGWSGTALGYPPFHRFFGLLDPGGVLLVGLLLAGLFAAAAWGLWRAPRVAGVSLAATLAGALAFGIYFRYREDAELFYFKDLGFLGPLTVACAVAGLGDLASRLPRARAIGAVGVAGLALLTVVLALNTRRELTQTFDYASRHVLELREWGERLPPGASVRIDVPPSGYQLWADYMLSEHPVSARRPLVGFFPYAPQGRKADYVLAMNFQREPADAIGAPRFENAQFRLWRMDPRVPGPDVSSRKMVDSVTKVELGLG